MASSSVFVSYQRADMEYARLLVDRLSTYGVTVWWDSAIGPGENWRERIIEALQSASIFVVLHSPSAEKSNEVRKEIAAAAALDKAMIAVRLENRPPGGIFLYEMAALNWVEAYRAPEEEIDKLAQRISTLPPRTATRDISERLGARPIRRSFWSRVTNSFALLAALWLLAISVGLTSLELLGRGLGSMATEHGVTVADLAYTVAALAVGAPLLLVRYMLNPPAHVFDLLLLLSAVTIIATYILLARHIIRRLRGVILRRGAG